MHSNIINFNKTFLPDLEKISKILMETLDIHCFEYTRLYKTGDRFYISNNQNWLEYFLKNKFHEDADHNKILQSAPEQKYILWTGLKTNRVLSGYFKNNMWNGLIYSLKSEDDCVDLFSFASTIEDKHVNNLYINNTDIINKIIMLFRSEFFKKLPLRDEAFLLKARPQDLLSVKPSPFISAEMINNFYEQTKVVRYYFNTGDREFYLTRMEFMCLALMSQGNSIKQVANQCSISPRTVETHLNSIKIKTGYTNRFSLISILDNSPFDFSKQYVKRI